MAGAAGSGQPLVVCTGGEPLLQLDRALLMHSMPQGSRSRSRQMARSRAPRGLDWICVSPKAGAELVQMEGDELKLVYPQPLAMPENLQHFASAISSCNLWTAPCARRTHDQRSSIVLHTRSGA